MSKKKAHPKRTKKEVGPVDREIALIESAYSFGNFKRARAHAANLLRNPDITSENRAAAAAIITKTGIDPIAFSAGFFCLVFSAIVAFLVGA